MSVEAVRSKQSRDFDPASFTVVPPRRFEDLRVGDVFRAPSLAQLYRCTRRRLPNGFG